MTCSSWLAVNAIKQLAVLAHADFSNQIILLKKT